MTRPFLHSFVSVALMAALLAGCATTPDSRPVGGEEEPRAGDEAVIFYPTFGALDGDHWVVPFKLRVHERRGSLEWLVTRVTRSVSGLTEAQADRFRLRIAPFLSDSESREVVTFRFDGDPQGREYRLEDARGRPVRTDLNGLAQGVLSLPVDEVRALVQVQEADDGWLSFHATSRDHTGQGRLQLVEPIGLSVISDIDDTIRITQVPAGARAVVRTTFFEEFEPAPGMVERFRTWVEEEPEGLVAVHYVSAGPWQLYPSLAEFLFDEDPGFPEGTFHMRDVRKNMFSVTTWRDLYTLALGDEPTYRHKVQTIAEIMERFPQREFVLVGDSGEHDPEVYRTIDERFPGQVREIVIRDVVEDLEADPSRLEGMTVIPAY